MPEEWSILRQWLPEDLQSLAQEKGFFTRRRGLQDAERWLRLKQTAVRAREFGLPQVAMYKRLANAEE